MNFNIFSRTKSRKTKKLLRKETAEISGRQDGTRTHNPVKEADFKSTAYTIPPLAHNFREFRKNLEAPTGVEPVYAVLQTAT